VKCRISLQKKELVVYFSPRGVYARL